MNELVKIKHCTCGYTVFCEENETEKECVCGKILDMSYEFDATMSFEMYEEWYHEGNFIIERDNDVMRSIVSLWNEFIELKQTHPDDIKDFCKAIHDLQRVMGMRELRRLMPHKYSIKE